MTTTAENNQIEIEFEQDERSGEVCLCGQTEPTQGWPCTQGGCHFVDPEKIKPLELWIAAAESARSTCGNLEEFDLLIAAQKKRLADLW